MGNPYTDSLVIILAYMLVWYVLAQWKRDNSIVDIGWGLGFVVLAVLLQYFYGGLSKLVLATVLIWGLRLSIYLFFRNKGKKEDWRYRQWREEWGRWAPLVALFKVFLLQGVFLWIIALPIMASANSQGAPTFSEFKWLIMPGLILWLFGFFWEAIADWQLYQFKAKSENKGKIMQAGLWAYSRHPNYFGEIVLWWGIFLISFANHPSWVSLLSPLTITWLLNRVSGVPMLEKKYADNPTYQAYVKRTNALVPRLFT